LFTLTANHDLNAEDLLTALSATATHRGVTLGSLSAAIGSTYGTDRARAYSAYRRRLGPDADRLPTEFTDVVNHVVAFADPLLTNAPSASAHWEATTRTWTS
jgi:hypothetical protein